MYLLLKSLLPFNIYNVGSDFHRFQSNAQIIIFGLFRDIIIRGIFNFIGLYWPGHTVHLLHPLISSQTCLLCTDDVKRGKH
jgi:hypothetical protein